MIDCVWRMELGANTARATSLSVQILVYVLVAEGGFS